MFLKLKWKEIYIKKERYFLNFKYHSLIHSLTGSCADETWGVFTSTYVQYDNTLSRRLLCKKGVSGSSLYLRLHLGSGLQLQAKWTLLPCLRNFACISITFIHLGSAHKRKSTSCKVRAFSCDIHILLSNVSHLDIMKNTFFCQAAPLKLCLKQITVRILNSGMHACMTSTKTGERYHGAYICHSNVQPMSTCLGVFQQLYRAQRLRPW